MVLCISALVSWLGANCMLTFLAEFKDWKWNNHITFPKSIMWRVLVVIWKQLFQCDISKMCQCFFPLPQCHHMSLMDFVVSPPSCGQSVTDCWGWDAHEAQLRCSDEVDGDIWKWSTRRGLNLSSTKLPRPCSPWESSPSRKNPHGRSGNRTRDLMISSQKLWPPDYEAGQMCQHKMMFVFQMHWYETPSSSSRVNGS
jgi:hypothetical protein